MTRPDNNFLFSFFYYFQRRQKRSDEEEEAMRTLGPSNSINIGPQNAIIMAGTDKFIDGGVSTGMNEQEKGIGIVTDVNGGVETDDGDYVIDIFMQSDTSVSTDTGTGDVSTAHVQESEETKSYVENSALHIPVVQVEGCVLFCSQHCGNDYFRILFRIFYLYIIAVFCLLIPFNIIFLILFSKLF